MKHKTLRELGTEPGMNIFANRTPEELERKRQQKGAGRGTKTIRVLVLEENRCGKASLVQAVAEIDEIWPSREPG